MDDVIVVETTGDKLVAVKRIDLDLADDSTAARELAYADNRVAQVGLEWDAEVILADINAGVEIGDFFREEELAEIMAGITDDDWFSAFEKVTDEDRAPFQQMTFVLHDSQIKTVKQAVQIAKKKNKFTDTPNKNSNGNALAYICRSFIDGNG